MRQRTNRCQLLIMRRTEWADIIAPTRIASATKTRPNLSSLKKLTFSMMDILKFCLDGANGEFAAKLREFN